MSASVSAVFMLVSDAPNFCGRYITRARISFMWAFCQAVELIPSGDFMSRMHKVAVAVIAGCVISLDGGVKPTSTDTNRGNGFVYLFPQLLRAPGALGWYLLGQCSALPVQGRSEWIR